MRQSIRRPDSDLGQDAVGVGLTNKEIESCFLNFYYHNRS